MSAGGFKPRTGHRKAGSDHLDHGAEPNNLTTGLRLVRAMYGRDPSHTSGEAVHTSGVAVLVRTAHPEAGAGLSRSVATGTGRVRAQYERVAATRAHP